MYGQYNGRTDNNSLDMRSLMHTLPLSSPHHSDGTPTGPSSAYYPANTSIGNHFRSADTLSSTPAQYWNHHWQTQFHGSYTQPNRGGQYDQRVWHGTQAHFAQSPGGRFFEVPPMQSQSTTQQRIDKATQGSSASMGPPRKPKQSGFALWIGNLPDNASLSELKDYFADGFSKDIESVFLISKSGCAFVNYSSENACNAALGRFHRSLFRGRSLVCRVRNSPANANAPRFVPLPEADGSDGRPVDTDPPVSEEPVIVGSGSRESATMAEHNNAPPPRADDKYFILKSLTIGDLEASLRDGTWSTQPHNESILSQAYKECGNVYLVFSANKSGEYFGFARMASGISTKAEAKKNADGPPICTTSPASQTAPKGWIVDDPSRGTLFWEIDRSAEDEKSPDEENTVDSVSRGEGDRSFAIQWLSTRRIPFHSTRGLRNSYNANREIKIARDGTEIEPKVARRLIRLFENDQAPIGTS